MKTLSFKEITKMDNLALTAVINYFEDYEPTAVLLSYAELKRRGYSFDGKLFFKLNQFSNGQKGGDIESLLSRRLKEMNFDSFSEFYENATGSQYQGTVNQAVNLESASDVINEVNEKYPALVTISRIYKICGWLVLAGTIAVVLFYSDEEGLPFIAFGIGALTALGLIAGSEIIRVFLDIERNTRMAGKRD